MSKEICVSARPSDFAPTVTLSKSATISPPVSASFQRPTADISTSQPTSNTVVKTNPLDPSIPWVSTAVTHNYLSYGPEDTHAIAKEVARLNAAAKKKNNVMADHKKFLASLCKTMKERSKSEHRRGRKGLRRAWAQSRELLEKKEEEEEEDLLNFAENLDINQFEDKFEKFEENKEAVNSSSSDEEEGQENSQNSFLSRQQNSIEKYHQRAAIKEETFHFTFRETDPALESSWDNSCKVEPVKPEEARKVLKPLSNQVHSESSLKRVIYAAQNNSQLQGIEPPLVVTHDKTETGLSGDHTKVVRIVLENTILDQKIKEKEKHKIYTLPYLHQCSSI
ncbi:hypothetical protein RCL1_001545 [Eukaryota sp. TZLM3-RCL]